ncbi:unnamed protein product [Urochloa humidicola]
MARAGAAELLLSRQVHRGGEGDLDGSLGVGGGAPARAAQQRRWSGPTAGIEPPVAGAEELARTAVHGVELGSDGGGLKLARLQRDLICAIWISICAGEVDSTPTKLDFVGGGGNLELLSPAHGGLAKLTRGTS